MWIWMGMTVPKSTPGPNEFTECDCAYGMHRKCSQKSRQTSRSGSITVRIGKKSSQWYA